MKGNQFACATLVVAFLLFLSQQGFSQSYRNKHPFDFKDFNLGFLMGFNYNSYNLKEQINIIDRGILLHQVEVVPRYGLTLGMIANYNFADQISLRSGINISLEQRDFNYFFQNDSLIIRKIEASYVNLPFVFQFKTKYYKATRVYVLSGAQIGLNLNSNKKVRDDMNLLKITAQDYSLIFGAGINLYGDRIKLSPEIRYSLGLKNIYEPEFTSHPYAISKLLSQVLVLVVNFE
ncbi:MAG: porin family protein [Bacteroidia bacterium]|nr:porin family protein [Bacteroidia bacterium]